MGCETFYKGSHFAAGHCACLQGCELLEEDDWRAVEECQEWELSQFKLLIDKSSQEEEKEDKGASLLVTCSVPGS